MADVLCFGNLQFDIVCRSVVTLPPPGELRLLDSINFMLSGNGGSLATSLGRLGIDVELAGYSGADAIGEQFRATLQEQGVGINKLIRHPEAGTGASVITLAPDGERSIMIVNGANALFDLATVPDAWLQITRLVVISSVFLLPQFTGEAVGRLFARARAQGVATLLNICWDTQGKGLSFLKPALYETDYFILNADEGRQLTGCSSPESILENLRTLTDATVVLTLGADGCCLKHKDTVCYVPAVPVEALDCTGAGDGFIAGFCAGILEKHSVLESARLGSITASFAVTGSGAYPRTPTLSEVKYLLSPG